jgi:hypothetical protein
MEHVKGHQDATKPIDQLSNEAGLNVQAEDLATDSLKTQVHGLYCELPANPVSILIYNQPITSKVKMCVRTAYLSKPLLAHLMKKLEVNQHGGQLMAKQSRRFPEKTECASKRLSTRDGQLTTERPSITIIGNLPVQYVTIKTKMKSTFYDVHQIVETR